MASAIQPTNVARVTMQMRSSLLLNNITSNNVDLLKAQTQLSSGLRISRPSDAPADATTVMHLDGVLERQGQYMRNIDFANNYLSVVDSALGEMTALVDDAYTKAMEGMNNVGVAEGGYEALAEVINGITSQMVTLGNTSYMGSYVFGGQNATETPFENVASGVMFGGSLLSTQTRVAADTTLAYGVSGDAAFGARSSEILGTADLDPSFNYETLLSDLNGATGLGVRLGSIIVNDGTTSSTVDLSRCVTVQDVIDKINSSAPATITASAAGSGDAFRLDSTSGDVLVTEVGSGTTARDLGIYDNVGGSAVLIGQDVDARLCLTTLVTGLASGAGIDLSSGMIITNSLMAAVPAIDFVGCSTVGDMLNRINSAPLGVRAEINSAGTGINIHNLLSGSQLTIGENGGTTATDLGVRSMVSSTALAAMNGGRGVATTDGVITVQARNGVTFDVALDTATTLQDVIDLINGHAGNGGIITASLNPTGNGLRIDDNTGVTTNPLKISTASTNGYHVAEQLGLDKEIAGFTLTGDDVNPIEPEGVFSHLLELRDAFFSHDTAAIQLAAEKLDDYRVGLRGLHGQVGAQVQALESRQARMQDSVLTLESLRSDIRDIDFAEAVTRYESLYTALQANMQSGSALNAASLLDYLV